jgi:hypothetical protein
MMQQQQQIFSNPNGLNFNQPNVSSAFGFRSGGMGGESGMWNHQGIKTGPNEAGDNEVEYLSNLGPECPRDLSHLFGKWETT